ncbi:MAG: AAA family ATPase [Candidatus Eisenbacteria bacterium]|nr:AAA family ATPase [Candidatus Eisenbacteria bacterium]
MGAGRLTPRYRRGLVVGKFAPLHLGHEALIRRALDQCHEVVVLSWSNPEIPGFEPERRERWLHDRFPTVRAIVLAQERMNDLPPDAPRHLPRNDADPPELRQFCAKILSSLTVEPIDAVFTSESYGDAFARHLTAFYRQHEEDTAEVAHVLVDPDRIAVPISGTQLRSDLHALRHFLAPSVYASFVVRVCLLGGESSGKSSLAAALASHFGTIQVEEYGRDLWEERDGRLGFEDLLRIAETQISREETALRSANQFLFCDTSPLTTLHYSHVLFSRADPRLEQLADRNYPRVVLCAPDFDFVQDGTRLDATFRARQHAWLLAELARRKTPYFLAEGPLPLRVEAVARWLVERGS